MDREESKKLSGRMLDTRSREAKAGRPRVGGLRPYGYSCSGVHPDDCQVPGCPHDGTLSIIPTEAAIIQEMADRVLAGESLYSLANDLTARDVPTLTGKKDWNSGVLTSILKNPRNAGLRAHNGIVVADGAWPAILDRPVWERLSLFLDNREIAGGRRRSNERSYVLVGFLFCGRCGAKLRSVQKQLISGGKRTEARKITHRAYACRKLPNQGGCAGLVIRADPVEQEVKEYLVGKLCDPKNRKRLLKLTQTADDESMTLAEQISDLEEQRDTLLDLRLKKKVSPANYEKRFDALTEAIEVLQRRAYGTGPSKILQTMPTTVEEFSQAWHDNGITFQRQLIDLAIDHIDIKPASTRGRGASYEDRLEWHPR